MTNRNASFRCLRGGTRHFRPESGIACGVATYSGAEQYEHSVLTYEIFRSELLRWNCINCSSYDIDMSR